MASAIFGTLAGVCALLAAVSMVGSVVALAIAAVPPRLSSTPVVGCALNGLLWAGAAVGLSVVSSATAGW